MNGRSRRGPWSLVVDAALVLLVLVVGLAGSVGAYRALALKAAAQQRDLLGAMGQSVIGAFDLQLVRAVEALQASSRILSSQPQLSRAQFAHYGKALVDESSVVTLLEWQPVVPGYRLGEFERQAALERPGYRVVEPVPDPQGDSFIPAQARELHVPVLYSWPESGAAVGVDMAFDERRMRSKLLARDTGGPVASETFPLIRRDRPGPAGAGFAVSLPVYRSAMPADIEERRRELEGFLAGVIELPALMREAALRADANDLDLFVFDQGEQHRLIFSSAGGEHFSVDARDMAYSVDVGGRPWQLVLRPRPGFAGPAADAMPALALAAAVLATLLVAFAVARSLVVRRRLERTEAVLAEDRQRLTNVLDGTAAGTWDWHIDSGAIVVNERWARMLGYSLAELHPITVATWERLCHPGDLVLANAALNRHLEGVDERYTAEVRVRHADGHWVWVLSSGRVFERDAGGRALRLAGTHMDISRRKADEQRLYDDARALEAANRQLRDLAILDALTGAFNRRHFNDVCLAALAGAQRGQAVALCMLDVDHFKAYNDHYGHQAGDAVLKALAQTLRDAIRRSTDALFRLGGEEFGVIFSAASAEAAQAFVGQLSAALHALALPHECSPQGIVTASFGLAWWAAPTSRLTPEVMYAAADAALYEAKRGGRDRVAFRCFMAGEGEDQRLAGGR
ncbi:diguanylate cyclase domain-containing protein [Roseateles saccharophilus]|uniref:diguanylate cyclase n=1 Tax=Roseateles saccharophilus TaxID=304 RepID=A0A4R3U9N2_ROSSA|nr:diguanylate cyclase [Roseateles saccharophilus]MDG0835831.1 diguanylate cyclase [Roseateles saccharophilus]TCU83416.1 PAS domain S-box-containing protein/diguanylate cyclase (GGDEF)-like protein [Roseateles saccharophilus]